MDVCYSKTDLNCLVVVILNYNSSDISIRTALDVASLDPKINIIIVDNCSNATNRDKLIDFSKINNRIRCCFNDRNSGYAAGNNYGIKEASKIFQNVDKICIMNPDISIPNVCIFREMIDILNKRKDIGALTVKTIFNGKKTSPNVCAWKFFSKYTMFFQGTLVGKLLNINPYYNNLDSNIDIDFLAKVDVVQGCFFIINRKVLENIGYFDENTFLYYEEMILGQKLKNKGYSNAVYIKHFIFHNHGSKENSLKIYHKRLFDMKCYLNSRLYYLEKYMPESKIYKFLVKKWLIIDYKLKQFILYLILKK